MFCNKSIKLMGIISLFILVGCQSAYYSAMEKVGTHKRDILIDRVEKATDSQEEAKQEFQDALEQFTKLMNFEGGELQSHYERSKDHYESSKEAAEDVAERISLIEDVAQALFDEWQDEIEQFSNQQYKQQSQAQLRDTERRYKNVIRAMHRAKDKMQPVLSALQDNMLYLKHNLNAKAIGSLNAEYTSIKQNVAQLIEQMNRSIDDSQAFIETLKTE
ncbi:MULTISPECIES: DUF2959 domain-containing protein [Thalassotalea]|uniref:DUF2959 domain-containing protein n=1 Tax=Thalassotalea TaxID=1518149 RepID=UPI000944BC35|nr:MULTISPECIES: DUF2959 domain-containing protein [Thalassotalea]OKY28025.1 DNA repair protein [Thalassotalea sp. PP2-459]